jgi:hypothetical protein
MPDVYLSHRLQAGPQRGHQAGSTQHCPARLTDLAITSFPLGQYRTFGIDPGALTANDANYLSGFQTANELRNR